jgi:hypothetical protein
MNHIPLIYLIFVACLCFSCAKSPMGKEQLNPTPYYITDATSKMNDTLPIVVIFAV